MEEHKQRARRRAQAHSAPLADDRFRVVPDEEQRSSRNPVGPVSADAVKAGNLDVVQPYVGSTTVGSNDIGPATLPSNERPGAQPGQAVAIGAEGAGALTRAQPAKAPGDRKGLGLLLIGIAVLFVIGGYVGYRAALSPSSPVDKPAPLAATGSGAEVPVEVAPNLPASVVPSQDPVPLELDDLGAAAAPSSSSGKTPRVPKVRPSGVQPPPSSAPSTAPKTGPRSPVIF